MYIGSKILALAHNRRFVVYTRKHDDVVGRRQEFWPEGDMGGGRGNQAQVVL